MSNIDKQALREEFQFMRSIYSDPADHERQLIYIAAEALLDELEAKEQQRANWFQMAQKLGEDLDEAEKRIVEFEALARGVKQFSEFQICHYGATEDYAKGYIDCQNNYNKVLFAAAGKGE
ncbi:ead/Ea22-like family protein [Enterobacter cancerogenus]|uniref:ead/Ea22-like family protein n=1 Tax=Enterobacter cancerogenus TaxID=69218 RepID=UPI001F44C2AF|nr:ead/Ea22-like family protein [Enterobacter cancerogenus]